VLKLKSFCFLYLCVAQNFQMPALRAWIHRLLIHGNEKFKLFYSSSVCVLLSVVFCLSLNLNEYHRYSLLLSWLASLGLFFGKNSLTQSLSCYFLLTPVINNFSPLNPISILVNALYAPVIGLIIFPMSLMTFLIHPLRFLTDKLWMVINNTNFFLTNFITPPQEKSSSTELIFLWLLALLVNLWLIQKENKKKATLCCA